MKITKTELLWTRACHLACAGCAMPNDLRLDGSKTYHAGTPEQWHRGMEVLRGWGSQFVAIYGAEPTLRVRGLAEVITSIYDVGMKATLITALPQGRVVADLLDRTPLDSITMSFDIVDEDSEREIKSAETQKALDALVARVPDVAVVVTVTALNAPLVADIADRMNDRGVWLLFDLLHDSGGPKSKCGHLARLDTPGRDAVRRMATDLLARKSKGVRIHASAEYLGLLADQYEGNPRALWHCRGLPTGWLTVDADGTVLACDDHQVPVSEKKLWDAPDADDIAAATQTARASCVGCAWNTHVDACLIEGGSDIGTYVHGSN